MTPKPAADSYTEMVQVVLPNDANPLGFILGGTVMHLIDIAGAIACHRHTRSLLVTAAVDGLVFLHPIKVGDLIILQARVTATFSTSLEVEVEVFAEGTLSGERKLTSRAYLTFVAIDRDGDKRLAFFTISDGKFVRENVTGTGKYEGMIAEGTVQPLGPFPTIKAGTFQNCNRQTGTYKLK